MADQSTNVGRKIEIPTNCRREIIHKDTGSPGAVLARDGGWEKARNVTAITQGQASSGEIYWMYGGLFMRVTGLVIAIVLSGIASARAQAQDSITAREE